MNDKMFKISFFMLSAYFGLSVYFSFFIAPLLFKLLNKNDAGLVVSNIFPSYFTIGIIAFFICLIYIMRYAFSSIIAAIIVIAMILLIIQLFYIIPESRVLKETNYDVFLKLHKWSMVFNILVILFNFIVIVYMFIRNLNH